MYSHSPGKEAPSMHWVGLSSDGGDISNDLVVMMMMVMMMMVVKR